MLFLRRLKKVLPRMPRSLGTRLKSLAEADAATMLTQESIEKQNRVASVGKIASDLQLARLFLKKDFVFDSILI